MRLHTTSEHRILVSRLSRRGPALRGWASPALTLLLTGLNLIFGSGAAAKTIGPGPHGYQITDEVPGIWEDISSTGTRVMAGRDDTHHYVSDIGFELPFLGNTFRDVSISSNGTLAFGQNGYLGYTNRAIPNTSSDRVDQHFVAVFWDDLINNRDAVYFETRGEPGNRRFVVQWNLQDHFRSTPQTATFGATMYEANGHIVLQYPDTVFGHSSYDNGASATVGIQENSLSGLQWSFTTAAITSGTVLTIVPEPATFSLLALSALGLVVKRRGGAGLSPEARPIFDRPTFCS